MKYSKILLFMTALSCLALQAYAQNPDQGLTCMENWLNQPDNYFPWYSSTGGSFYGQPYSDTTFSPFREYYVTSGTPVVGGIISNPTTFNIAQKTPSRIYYGNGQALPYTQYVSTVPSKTNDHWVQGATNWTQYVVSPVGTWLQLVANAPVGGPSGLTTINLAYFNLGNNIPLGEIGYEKIFDYNDAALDHQLSHHRSTG